MVRWPKSPPVSAAAPPAFGYKPAERAGAATCATYLTNKAPYLGYDTALAEGWPIATGVLEGAARHLLKDGMDITGAPLGP